jgi:hypothetical protein
MTRMKISRYSRLVMKGLQQANAFVIQFRDSANSETSQYSGRVEHVSSGRTANFRSLEELPELLLQMLKVAASSEAAERG